MIKPPSEPVDGGMKMVGMPMRKRLVCGGRLARNPTTGMISVIIPVVRKAGSVAGEFGYRFLGAVIVDERFTGGGCGDERSRRGVVERPWQAEAGLVEAGDGVVCKERIGATDQSQMVTQVLRRFTEIHRVDLVARGNPLIQSGKDAHAQLTGKGRLADQ